MTQALNFNVGDVVLDLQDMGLWNNVYHYKNTLVTFRKSVVLNACERLFTTDMNIDTTKVNGLSDWDVKRKVCEQKNGRGYDGSQAFVNYTTRERDVRAHVKKLFDKEIERCDKEDAEMIARIESEIAAKQRQIEEIKAGRRRISYKTDVIEREFLQERYDALVKVLDE